MEEEINFTEIIKIFMRRLKTIVLITSTIVLSTIFYTYIVDPIFTASVHFIPYNESKPNGILGNSALASIAGLEADKDTEVEVALSTLKSRTFLNEFAEEESLLPILFESKWNKKKMTWHDKKPTEWELTDKAI